MFVPALVVSKVHAAISSPEKEIKMQTKKLKITPNYMIACVGGGSNAIGMFSEFLKDKNINLVGVEAYGKGTGRNA